MYKIEKSLSKEDITKFIHKNGEPIQVERGHKAHKTVDSVNISVRLPSTLVGKIDSIAEDRCTRGSVIRHILQNSFTTD